MKFVTDSAKTCAARLGKLENFKRISDISFETPLALIYTKRGSVPHLTKDVFEYVTSKQHVLSISLPSTMSMFETIKEVNVNFANFVSMKEHINFLSVHDPTITTTSGFSKPDSLPIWTRGGRKDMTANKYMDIVEAFKPDFYVALCDGDTNINSSSKRVSKAVNRSKIFLEHCISRHVASESLKSTGILGAVEGGYNLDARTCSVNNLIDKPLMGYVIDGLHNNGPDVRNISSEQIKEVVEHTLKLLPAEKLKMSMGCWNPVTVLHLVELGVDVFDTSYPSVATENGEALTFLCDHDSCNNASPVLSIADKRYRDDFSPICKHCQCLACRNHTRAYMNHLNHTKELLGMVLLMIHNLHHYLQFFNDIRENIKNGTFSEFQKRIECKFSKN